MRLQEIANKLKTLEAQRRPEPLTIIIEGVNPDGSIGESMPEQRLLTEI